MIQVNMHPIPQINFELKSTSEKSTLGAICLLPKERLFEKPLLTELGKTAVVDGAWYVHVHLLFVPLSPDVAVRAAGTTVACLLGRRCSVFLERNSCRSAVLNVDIFCQDLDSENDLNGRITFVNNVLHFAMFSFEGACHFGLEAPNSNS